MRRGACGLAVKTASAAVRAGFEFVFLRVVRELVAPAALTASSLLLRWKLELQAARAPDSSKSHRSASAVERVIFERYRSQLISWTYGRSRASIQR